MKYSIKLPLQRNNVAEMCPWSLVPGILTYDTVQPRSICIAVKEFVKCRPMGIFKMQVHETYDGWRDPGGRLNKKDGLTRYGDSHVKDKTS